MRSATPALQAKSLQFCDELIRLAGKERDADDKAIGMVAARTKAQSRYAAS